LRDEPRPLQAASARALPFADRLVLKAGKWTFDGNQSVVRQRRTKNTFETKPVSGAIIGWDHTNGGIAFP
jgi:hypothetical protein